MAKRKFVRVVDENPQSHEPIHGRGASWSPANRFEKLHVDLTDVDVVDADPEEEAPSPQAWLGHRAAVRRFAEPCRIPYGPLEGRRIQDAGRSVKQVEGPAGAVAPERAGRFVLRPTRGAVRQMTYVTGEGWGGKAPHSFLRTPRPRRGAMRRC